MLLPTALLAAACALAVPRAAAAQQPAAPPRAPAAPPARQQSAGTAAPNAAPNASAGDDDGAGASAESAAELEALLARVRTDNLAVRRAAVEQLLAREAADVPALRARLLAPLGTSHFNVHAAMVRAIRAITGGRENAEYDLLTALVQLTPRGPDVDIATERVALARALGRIPSSDAGRALFAFGLEHNRIFRLETIRIVRGSMRDYVLPALIEARRPTDDTRLFIRQIREAIRRVTPGETVQTRDNALLAEIIRAYGSVRQPDAMNVVISFVNSDRSQVRDAARWAIAQYGREAINVLRTAYENYVGESPNQLWGWERTARELYAASDRRRDDEVARAMDEGVGFARAGRFAEMLARYEFVLAHHPLYSRRAEMVDGLVRYARELETRDAARAETLYRTALRIDPEGPQARAAHGAILYLEAERALARGVADPELYRAALRADPANARAQAQLEAVAQVEILRARQRKKTLGALGLLVLALAGVGLLATRGRGGRSGHGGDGATRGSGGGGGATSSGGASGSATSSGDGAAAHASEQRPASAA